MKKKQQLKEKEMSEQYKCYYCDEELVDKFYANYYTYEYDPENMLCGDGDCWAEWMQDNTYEIEIEEDEE